MKDRAPTRQAVEYIPRACSGSTRDWSVSTIERSATAFAVAGDALLATGGSWDPAARRTTGIGVAVFGFDGGKRFQVFDGEHARVALAYDGRASVGSAGQEFLRVVDLTTGHLLGTRQLCEQGIRCGGSPAQESHSKSAGSIVRSIASPNC